MVGKEPKDQHKVSTFHDFPADRRYRGLRFEAIVVSSMEIGNIDDLAKR